MSSFELTGADGGPLRGEVRTAARGADRPAVVICHGFKGFKDWGFFPYLAARLARGGMTAVTFNFSGAGVGPDGESFSEPERFGRATVSNDLADLNTVCQALLDGSLVPGLAVPTRLGLFGHSRGGAVALLQAARTKTCRALVTWAAVADFRRWGPETLAKWRADGKLDIVNTRTGEVLPLYTDCLADLEAHCGGRLDLLRAAESLDVPWLIVHGEVDKTVPPSHAERLYRAVTSGDATLQVVRGGSHTLGAQHPWAGSTQQLEQGVDATVDWFSRCLW